MAETTRTKPQMAAFEVTVKLWTKDGADAIHDNPEQLRFVLGEALDRLEIQEEIDYTLEVKRIHDYAGRLPKEASRG